MIYQKKLNIIISQNRFVVPLDDQLEFESEKLWLHVSSAIKEKDQHLATEEKTKVELRQREAELERKAKFIDYKSKFFTYDPINKEWIYNFSDLRPWDPQTDLFQTEANFQILTKTKHNLKSIETGNPLRHSHHHHHHHHHSRNALLTHSHHHRHQRLQLVQHPNAREEEEDEDEEEEVVDSSFGLLVVQYNEIKERLHKIENNVVNLTTKLDDFDIGKAVVQQRVELKRKSEQAEMLSNPDSLKMFMFVALVAWFVGIFSARFLFRGGVSFF
jgi:hypothetical protein